MVEFIGDASALRNFNKSHPEKLEDEIFLTNATHSGFENLRWRTKRLGVTAFDENGERVDPQFGLFPVFVKRLEWEDIQRFIDGQLFAY